MVAPVTWGPPACWGAQFGVFLLGAVVIPVGSVPSRGCVGGCDFHWFLVGGWYRWFHSSSDGSVRQAYGSCLAFATVSLGVDPPPSWTGLNGCDCPRNSWLGAFGVGGDVAWFPDNPAGGCWLPFPAFPGRGVVLASLGSVVGWCSWIGGRGGVWGGVVSWFDSRWRCCPGQWEGGGLAVWVLGVTREGPAGYLTLVGLVLAWPVGGPWRL